MNQLPFPGIEPALSKRVPALCDPAFQRHSPTSEAAAVRIQPHAGTLGALVLSFLTSKGEAGATDEEMQLQLPMAGNTQRPRRVDLLKRGFIRASGRTRPTISGDQAVVWVVVGN